MAVTILTASAPYVARQALTQEIALAVKGPHPDLILITPQQSTHDMESQLIDALGGHGLMGVSVLSFNRLAQQVLLHVGGAARPHLDEKGRAMAVRRAVMKVRDKLTVLRGVSLKPGFLIQCAQWIGELKKYDVTPEQLIATISGIELPAMRDKLRDFAMLYEQVHIMLADQYIDGPDTINLLVRHMHGAPFLRGARIWIEGLESFTPQVRRMLRMLMMVTQDVTICLLYDPNYPEAPPYRRDASRLTRIMEMAHEDGVAIRTRHIDQEDTAISAPLRHIRQAMVTGNSLPYMAEPEGVSFFSGRDPDAEATAAAIQMLALARRGMRYRDMAVVCGDLLTDGPATARALRHHGIPCFLDEKRPMRGHPAVEALLGALHAIARQYPTPSLIRYMKAGFTGLASEDLEDLQSYAASIGLHYRRWRQPLRKELQPFDLAKLETSRDMLMAPLLKLEKAIGQTKSVEKMAAAVYAFLAERQVPEQLERLATDQQEQGDADYADISRGIWEQLMQVIDQLVELLGGESMDLPSFVDALQQGCDAVTVGLIPTTLDQVPIGDLSRSRGRSRALFILGMNEELIPPKPEEHVLLTENELTELCRQGLEAGRLPHTRIAEADAQVYELLTRCSERIFISHSYAQLNGSARLVSPLFEELLALFPHAARYCDLFEDQAQQARRISSPEGSFAPMIAALRAGLNGQPVMPFIWDCYRWYHDHPAYGERVRSVASAMLTDPSQVSIPRELARRVFGDPLITNISRLEQYAACPFSHLVEAGIKPRELPQYDVSPIEVGNLQHEALSRFVQRMIEQNADWKAQTYEDCEAAFTEAFEQALPQHMQGYLLEDGRGRALRGMLLKAGSYTAYTAVCQIAAGRFEPKRTEARFGPGGNYPALPLVLPDGSVALLTGVIDRIDRDESTGQIRVIDYKTGAIRLQAQQVTQGTQLQLPLYMLAAVQAESGDEDALERILEMGKKALQEAPEASSPHEEPFPAAGMFYLPVDDPMPVSEQRDPEALEQERGKSMRLSGRLLDEPETIEATDTFQGASTVVAAERTGKGALRKREEVVSREELAKLLYQAYATATQLASNLMRGEAPVQPVKQGQQDACRYCDYKTVCRKL